MQVHYDEGIANHIGPEPCVAVREGGYEASVGVHVGQPWSHEMVYFPDADVLQYAEGNVKFSYQTRCIPRKQTIENINCESCGSRLCLITVSRIKVKF